MSGSVRLRKIAILAITVCVTFLAGCAGPAATLSPEGGPLQIVARGQDVTTRAIQARPGDVLELYVAQEVCCVFYQEIDLRVTWSVEPAGVAIIDRDGKLVIADDTPADTVLTITAAPRRGDPLTAEVHLYAQQDNTLVGKWIEEAQFDCQSGAEFEPASPIRELVFYADGSFQVTWFPFEAYVDYSGTYTFDQATGTLSLTPRKVNYLPDDLDGEGAFSIDDQGRLLLVDMWLGAPPPHGEAGPTACGQRFKRTG